MIASLEHSITAARDYLLRSQAADGSWTDWDLPTGSSSIWTTAYVALRLHALPRPLHADADGALKRAARWLRRRQFNDGGWGYNETVGSDADSTSFCVLLLDAVDGGAPQSAVDFLLAHQQADGGFATYTCERAFGTWTKSHNDVTPVALRALLPHVSCEDPRIGRGIAFVLRRQDGDGTWPSFWWRSAMYATEASLALLRAVGARRSATDQWLVEPPNAFECALLLSCETLAASRATSSMIRGVERLIRTQRCDGSWTSAPVLRVTRRDCLEPWAARDAGPLYADPNRLFTSATALGALARYAAEIALRADTEVAPPRRRALPRREAEPDWRGRVTSPAR